MHRTESRQYLRRSEILQCSGWIGNSVNKYSRARSKTDKARYLAAEPMGYIAEETSRYSNHVDK